MFSQYRDERERVKEAGKALGERSEGIIAARAAETQTQRHFKPGGGQQEHPCLRPDRSPPTPRLRSACAHGLTVDFINGPEWSIEY